MSSLPVVVIDPGHGGQVGNQASSPLGVRGPSGVLEKNVTLAIAQRVAGRLGSRARAVLTRDADTNPSLAERAATAARQNARVFLSLHANGADPAARGAELYVHEGAGGASLALAGNLARALARGRGSGPAHYRAPMTVLAPQLVGAQAAACLVEVDYLSNPEIERRLGSPDTLDTIADHLSRGILSYLQTSSKGSDAGPRGGGPAALGYRFGDGFSDEAIGEMTAYTRDERAADKRQISTVADATALVDAYIARGSQTVWPNVDATVVAQQIKDRCADHRLFQQGNLNLCGPAAFLTIWAGRDPVGYARYAIGILENGTGAIGSTTISASPGLEAITYPRLGRPTLMTAPAADFVCMSPLRNDANAILPYDPSSGLELVEALTTPGELAGWLRATGAFSSVRDQGNWARSAGIDHALDLMVGAGMDAAVLINVNALASAGKVEAVSGGARVNPMTPDRTFILNMFPNHFVVLLSEIVPDISKNTLSLSVWSWAGSYVFSEIPVRTFSTNYYGAVKTASR
jgi:N-acetylmuramoyl-L-alanine amidase